MPFAPSYGVGVERTATVCGAMIMLVPSDSCTESMTVVYAALNAVTCDRKTEPSTEVETAVVPKPEAKEPAVVLPTMTEYNAATEQQQQQAQAMLVAELQAAEEAALSLIHI